MSLAIQAGQALAESKNAIPFVRPESASNGEAAEQTAATIREEINTFGKRLAYARKQAGLTQKQLAEKVGVSSSAISGYETGKREPGDQKVWTALSNILKVSEEWLHTGKAETLKENIHNIPSWSIRRFMYGLVEAFLVKTDDDEGKAAFEQMKNDVDLIYKNHDKTKQSVTQMTIEVAMRYERFVAEMKAREQTSPPPQNVTRREDLIVYLESEDQGSDLEGGEAHGTVVPHHVH